MIFNAFILGLFDPLLVPTHALALLSIALLVGQQRRRLLPSTGFVLALAAGLFAIAQGVAQMSAGDVMLAAAAISGLLVALCVVVPNLICAALAAIVGLALGLDSPPQAITLATANLMLIGTGFGACLAFALIVAGTSLLDRDWQRIGVRIVGSWIAASAMLVLALRYARGMLF